MEVVEGALGALSVCGHERGLSPSLSGLTAVQVRTVEMDEMGMTATPATPAMPAMPATTATTATTATPRPCLFFFFFFFFFLLVPVCVCHLKRQLQCPPQDNSTFSALWPSHDPRLFTV